MIRCVTVLFFVLVTLTMHAQQLNLDQCIDLAIKNNIGLKKENLTLKYKEKELQFQKNNDLEETRFVDNATWEKLHRFDACGLIVNGEINVKAVQQALANAGEEPGKVDGAMGKQTKRALIAFQKSKGFRGDGVIGPKTLYILAQQLEGCTETEGEKE